ncbi:uncharacterized protein rab44 [Solea solea]|uniref:uncharacterized protein rab44 n=1 Tax=Solea solea TaxID=90069 RepID=UPI0027299449|nr:uncharacterized protein rab44 [Solea solea]
MSSHRKKRFGSHRRVANQNETPKTDEIHATGNSNVAQHHIPEENIESLCVQSNSSNMPSPELRANRRKLGSRRKNKGQHERDLAAELSDKPKEEVENSVVNEALETQLAVHSERQEELCESHEHEMSATSDDSLYSAVMSAYCGVQNYTNCPEDIPENQQVEQDEDELDSKLMSSSNFVEPMREGADESDSIRSDLFQDNAPLIGSSERVLSSQPGVSCVTEIEEKKWSEDADLLQQEGNLKSKESHEEMTTDKSNTTQHNKLECRTDTTATVSSSKDELSADERQNEQFSQTQHSSEERDVNTTVNRRKLASSRKNKRQQRVEDSVARPYHETKEEVVKNLRGYGDLETSNMSSLETAVQLQPVDMMEEMDQPDNHQTETLRGEVREITHTVGISDLYNPSSSSVTDAGSKESDENPDLFRNWGGSEAGNLVESTMTLVKSTEKFNQDTEYEQSVEQTADSSPKHEISTNKEDEQFCVSEVGRAQDVDNAVKLMHNEDVKPAATQDIYLVDYSSESVIHDATEDSEVCSISPSNLTEVGDSYQSELSVKSNGDCATKQGLLNLDEKQDECLTQDNNVGALDQKNEDSAVYDSRNTQTSDIERIDPAVEGWLEDDIKSVVEQSSDHEEEGLSEPMENKTPQTLQSETHSPLESQPHDYSVITDKQDNTENSEELGSVHVNEGEQNVNSSGAESEMSLTMETAVQEMSEETMLEGNDRFDPAHTEEVSDQAKENAQASTSELTSTSEHSSPPVDQQTTEQSNTEQIPQELSSVYSVTDTESKEGDEDNDLLKQWGNLQSNNLENEIHFKSEDVESSVTPDITTEEGNHEEPTEPERRVERAIDPSPNDETSTKDEQSEPYSGALDTKDAVTKVHKEDVKETEMHQVDCSSDEASKYSQSLQSEIEPSLDLQPNDSSQNIREKIHTGFKSAGNRRKLGSSRRHKERQHVPDSVTESVIHDGTEDSENCSVNLTDQTEVSDSYQSESSVKSKATCANKQEVSDPEEKQDMFLNVDTLDHINEDLNVYDLQKTQTSDIEGVDPAEDDIKSTVEQSSQYEEEGILSELVENKTLQTLQSETHSPLESQPHDYSVTTDKQDNTENSEELGSVHVNEGEQNVNSSGAESEMSLTMETAVQEMSEETMLEGNDRFDPAHTEGVSDQAKENAQASASELTSTSEHSSPPVDQQTTEQSNTEQIPQEPSSVYSVTDTESKEGDEDNDLLKQWGNLQSNNLENETHFKSEDVESSVTPDITTEEGNHEEPTEPEYRVEQATDPSPKDETSTKDEQSEPYSGALDTKDAVTKAQKEDVKETALHQVDCSSDEASKYSQSLQSEIEPSLDLQPNDSSQNIKEKIHTGFKPAGIRRKLGSSRRHKERQHVPDSVTESVIHDGTEDSENSSVNLTDQTEVSDSYQSESSAKSKATCANKQEVSNPEEKQDMFLNVDTLDQINEDLNVYDLQKTQTSDIEGVDPAEDDIKSTVEQSSEYEEEGVLSELVENKTLQTLQSETHSPLESQPHDYSVITDKQDNTENSEELGSVHVNEGEQNVSSSGAESEMSLMMETAVQEMSEETMLEGKDRFDPAHTEGVSDQAKENAHASASELTSTTEQSNTEQIPQEPSSVYSVTDTESKEGDEDNDLLKQWGNLQSNNLENETHFKSEDVESSVTPDITTEEGNHEEPTEPECRVEQATVSSPKDETSTKDEQSELYSVSEVRGTLCPENALKEVSNEEFQTKEMQENHVTDYSTENVIHDETEKSEICFVNPIDQTEVSDSYQSESSVKSNATCANKQEVSNPEERQDMFLNVDTLDQINEDFNVYDPQETQTSDIEGVDPAEDDIKSTVEQSSEYEEEGVLSELVENKTLQTLQSETHSPLESQLHDYSVITDKQDNTENSEELGSVHVNEGEQNVSSSGAESEMSLMMETAVQEMSEETMLEGKDRFDPAHTEGVSVEAKENAQASASELTSSNSEPIPQELSSVYSVTDTESKEGDEDNDLLKQWGNLQSNNLENETHFKSEDVESSVTPDITTEERNHEEPTEPECRVEQATDPSPKDETSTKDEQSEPYSGALDTKDAVTKVQKEDVKETEMHQVDCSSDEASKYSQSLQSEIESSLDLQPNDSSQNIKEKIHTGFKPAGIRRKLGSSRRHKERQHVPDSVTESVIHDGTEDSENCSVNLTDQTEVSDSYQSESSAKSKATCANKQEVSNPEEKQDMFLNVDTLDQINEDLNVYDLQKTQTSDIEGVDPAEDIKSTVEPSSQYEEEGILSELVENKTLQTLQSETHSPLESQPHDYSVITDKQDNTENSEELGSVHVNEGEQNVSSSGAESEMSLTMETAVQEMSEETMLEGKDRFDPAHTEGASDQAKENAQASASELTSSNSEPIPQELSSVYSVTDTESKEGDEDNDLLKQWGNLQSNNLENETHFKSEEVESSVTPDITTEEGNHEEPTEPECRVERAIDPSPKDETSTKDEQSEPYSGALDTKDAVTKAQKEDVKETALHQVDCSSDEASKYSQSSHKGNRRKLGSSRRHKERQHVPVPEAYSELKEKVVKSIPGDEVSEKEKMPSVTETMRQDILQEQIGLDFNPTEKMRKNRSTIKDKENAEQRPQEDTTLQPQNSVESSATVSTESDDVKSTEQVNELEKKLITEPKDLSPPTGGTDWRESAEASDLKHCDDTDSNRSVTCDVLHQKEAKQTAQAATIQDDNTEADRSMDVRGPEQVEVREICGDNTSNTNVTCALVDTGHEENSRPKPAVTVSEESEISGTPAASNSQQGTPTKPPVHANVQGTRRKMGSTRKSQLNRKQMYDTDETKVNNVEQSGERNNDSMEGVEESSLILTKDVSQRGNTQSSLSNVTEEQQKMNGNNSVHDETPKQQSCTPDLQATECNVIPGTDDSTVLSPEQAASHTEEAVHPVRSVQGADEESVEVTQGPGSIVTEAPAVALVDMEKIKCVQEPNSVTEGAQNTNFETMNANFSPANRRRKMGSTRRNLGSRSREKDLYQKQEEDNEVTATIRAGDASTESVSGVIAKEPQLHDENTHSDSEQRKETVVETVECSDARESHVKPPALENIEVTPGSLSQPAGMESHLTPEPRTSPKHDVTSESAAGGRRRKMGSHRKSHPRQNAKDQIVGEDRLMDTQQEGDITRLTDEKDERREESLGLDRLSEVDKRDEKPTSNISISGAAEHSQILSVEAPKRVTPVSRPDAGIHLNQEIQNKFSSGAASSDAGVKSRVFNVMLVGDSSVGKTSFLKRAQSGKFSSDLPSSLGIDSYRWTVVVDGKPVVLQLWDTAGQERFRSITRQVFHRAQAFLLMYDISSSESFSAVSYWANCIQEGAAENVTILLLGNKSDCAERQIKPEEGETLSKEYNFDFMECSAATGENVIQTLETVARILKQNADTREESMVLHKEPPHKKRSGCC